MVNEKKGWAIGGGGQHVAMISIDERCKSVGLNLAQLARKSAVPYRRLWSAEKLRPDEVGRVEQALAEAAQATEKTTAAGLASAAVKGGAHDSDPRAEQ